MLAEALRPLAVAVDKLHALEGNPRRGDVESVARSLRKFGQRKPIVARRDDGTVVAGNHTLLAARKLGWPEIAVVWVDDDDATAKAFALADNRTSALGTFDDADLAAMVAEVHAVDPDLLEAASYTADDLNALLGLDPDDLPEETDPVGPPPADPVSVLGDVWHLGPHRLLCGDSTDMAAVEAMLEGDRCDVMWTDPPYGVDYVGKTKDALTIQNDGAQDLPALLAGAFAVATAALKPGSPVYVAHPAGALHRQFLESFFAAGWLLREGLIWVKDVMVLGHSDYHFRHEPIMYGFTDGGEGRLGRGGERWYGDHSQTSVFEVPKPSRSEDHPTMKPIELITRMLGNSCPRGGLVYEPFGGSGSTLIAAHAMSSAARVVELDPRYVDVICRRYQKLTGDKPVLASTGEPHDFCHDD